MCIRPSESPLRPRKQPRAENIAAARINSAKTYRNRFLDRYGALAKTEAENPIVIVERRWLLKTVGRDKIFFSRTTMRSKLVFIEASKIQKHFAIIL